MKKTVAVKSKQSGFVIDLPAQKVASIKIISLFGDNETNEGSVAQIVDGSLDGSAIEEIFVKEGDQ